VDGYDTLDTALIEAATATRELHGNRYESISLVYEKDGRYYFTPPATQRKSDKQVKAAISFPKGATARMLVHNHPEASDHDRFSAEDVQMATALKVPSAIIFGKDAPTIRVFTPGVSKVEGPQRGPRAKLHQQTSKGEEFMRFPKLHAADSAVNRIMNVADDIEAAEEPEQAEAVE
jgi:hypothetical protein